MDDRELRLECSRVAVGILPAEDLGIARVLLVANLIYDFCGTEQKEGKQVSEERLAQAQRCHNQKHHKVACISCLLGDY